MAIPIKQFGKDHWSLLAYLETLTVDHTGDGPDPKRMRTNPATHPLHAIRDGWKDEYTTRLAEGFTAPVGHDDWDCMDDLEEAGLILPLGGEFTRMFKLTEEGQIVAQAIRLHKANRGSFGNFDISSVRVTLRQEPLFVEGIGPVGYRKNPPEVEIES